VRILDAARQEVLDGVTWYERQRSGLGRELRDAFDEAVERIELDPEACPLHEYSPPEEAFRRQTLNRFPYSIVFAIRDDEPLIVAFENH
jgi:hypothetical protein